MSWCVEKKIQRKRFVEGNLTNEEAESFKTHLRECEACLQDLYAVDPLLMFSLLSQQKKENSFWQGYWVSLREQISEKKGWFEWLGFARPLPAAAVLSSLVIVTFLFLFAILNQSPVGTPPVVEVLPAEEGVVEETVLNPPLLIGEGKGLESANIVTVSVENTDIVMIYDESMDI